MWMCPPGRRSRLQNVERAEEQVPNFQMDRADSRGERFTKWNEFSTGSDFSYSTSFQLSSSFSSQSGWAHDLLVLQGVRAAPRRTRHEAHLGEHFFLLNATRGGI